VIRRVAFATVLLTGAAVLAAAPAAQAATREFWVAATPALWNMAPNQRDDITSARLEPAQTVLQTTVYRRYSPHWRRPLPNTPASGNQNLIPGPLLRAQVGDKLVVHFKNMDFTRMNGHSMHFHGVEYKPSSDGSYVPGVSGRDGNVLPGASWTYRLTAGPNSAGAWPYHDHSSSMHESIDGGMYGMLSIRGRHEALPDREFVVVFTAMGDFQTIDGRAFVGNTPVFRAKVGDLVQWDVMGMGSEHHTFHVHGHRWREPGGVFRDTHTVGPAESFRFRWRERDPGVWLYHCHVEQHMAAGMIGTYRVSR
jgi:FtsP/CotA-like multicopper oxidase with cupredoxin domain